MLKAGKFRLGAQIGQHRGNARIRAGNRAIDAFMGQKQRTLDALRLAERIKRLAEAFEPREGRKMIERGHTECAALFMARILKIVCHGVRNTANAAGNQRISAGAPRFEFRQVMPVG